MLEFHPTHEYGMGYYFREIGLTDTRGFFVFARPVKNYRFESEWNPATNTAFNRCDNEAPRNAVLPAGFHEWDYDTETCSCGSTDKPYGTTNMHDVCLTACKVFRIPVQTTAGFICYFEYNDVDREVADIENSDCVGRTFQEIFRCILEWQWVHLNMDNQENIAVTAHEFVQTMNIPDDIVDWLWADVPDQHVARYLRGIEHPRQRNSIEQIPDMSQRFNLWLEEHIVFGPVLWPYGPR